jgi:para-nitrobenzyl esterase
LISKLSAEERVIELPAGAVRVHERSGLVEARGLRYAHAARFERPEPIAAWAGVVDATKRGPACPQAPYRLDWVTGPIMAPLAFDEDCLRLSVTAPLPFTERRPVLVWIHGGAYISGSGEAPAYDPCALAREQGVVVVRVSYRLGLFGFLAIEGVAPANLGLADMLQALRWVQANVAAFGGDPANVTLVGHSAGAHAALHLMLASEARGLFRRAILQSAPLGLSPRKQAVDRALSDTARRALGGEPARVPIERALAAQLEVTRSALAAGLQAAAVFGPQLGHWPLPDIAPLGLVARAIAKHYELMIGATKHDASPFVALEPRFSRMRRLGALGRNLTELATRVATHRVFAQPARALAQEVRGAGGRACEYRFDWRAPDSALGACHCIELPFLFGTDEAWKGAPMLGTSEPASRMALARAVRAHWAQFARSGVEACAERRVFA